MTGSLEHNLEIIREKISIAAQKSGRSIEEITLVAVTKTVSEEVIKQALSLGITDIGENRVQEYLAKRDCIAACCPDTRFHIIGTLQTNKVKYLAGQVELIQSVNSEKVMREINKKSDRVQNVLLEVNIGREESKTGILAEQLPDLLEKASQYKNVRVKGLMTIPPIQTKPDDSRRYFESMNKLFVDIKGKKYDNVYMDILSMGMSDDYFEAVCEGANMVRLGRAIFGNRK